MQHTNDKQQVTQAVDSLQPNNKLQDLSTVSDAEILQLIHELGNCFVEDNAYQLQKENKATALKMAKHFMGMGTGRDKGFLIIGANGTGKTLIFRIMQVIAPWFGMEFDWLNATRIMNKPKQDKSFNVDEYRNKKPLYINDLGRDMPGKYFGNPVDAIYDILDHKNDLMEEGVKIRLYATTNLGVTATTEEGLFEYLSLTGRYDARIASRAKALFNILFWESGKKGGLRGETDGRTPSKSELKAVMLRFMNRTLGYNPIKDLMPYQKQKIERKIHTVSTKQERLTEVYDASGWTEFVASAYKDLTKELDTLHELVFKGSEIAVNQYGEIYEELHLKVKSIRIKAQIEVCHHWGRTARTLKNAGEENQKAGKPIRNYYAYCNAYSKLESTQIELRCLIFEDAPKDAFLVFGEQYIGIRKAIQDLYWKPASLVNTSKGTLGERVYKSFGGVKDYENRTKNIHRIEEVVGIESNQ